MRSITFNITAVDILVSLRNRRFLLEIAPTIYSTRRWPLIGSFLQKWDINSTYRDIFGQEKPNGEKCKATFCKMFGIKPALVDIKEKWTLVFALQQDGSIGNLPSQKDPPDWVAKAAKAAKELSQPNPTPSAAQSPALPENRPSPQKKQKTIQSDIDECIKTLGDVVAKDKVGPTKAVLDDLVFLLDGKLPTYSHSYRGERKKKLLLGLSLWHYYRTWTVVVCAGLCPTFGWDIRSVKAMRNF